MVVGLAIGAVGVLMAVLIRARWARPVGAILLVVALLAVVAAVQAGPSDSAGGVGHTSPPRTLQTVPIGTPAASASPSGVHSVTPPPVLPRLLKQIHPGLLPIVRAHVLNKEFIRLTNTGTGDVHIGGWTVSNGTFSYTFSVGAVVPHGQSLVIRTGPGTNLPANPTTGTPATIHLNSTHYVWAHTGGHVVLKDGTGRVIQNCTYRAVTVSAPSAFC